MNIGTPIDWAATGSMLGGLATLAGAAAVAFAAWFGASQWRAQKVSEFQMDVAQEILKAVYELEDNIKYVLSNIALFEEQKECKNLSPESDVKLSEIEKSLAGNILIARLESINPSVLSVRAKRVDARLSFGSEGWEKLHAVHDLVVELRAAASILADEEKFQEQVVADRWSRFFPAAGEVGYLEMFEIAISSLEQQLIPVLEIK